MGNRLTKYEKAVIRRFLLLYIHRPYWPHYLVTITHNNGYADIMLDNEDYQKIEMLPTLIKAKINNAKRSIDHEQQRVN